MEKYSAALASNNLEGVVALYSANGAYERPDFPAAVGTDAIRAAYKEVFSTLKVNVTFDIREVAVSGDLAYVRAESGGRVKRLKTGQETSDAYHVLVVMQRESGVWKIRSYLYAPANAATGSRT